jgi:hypothetical protein
MGRIGEATVRERIAHQQVAEFVVNARYRDGEQRKNRKTKSDEGEEYNDDGETLAFSEVGDILLEATEEVLSGFRKEEGNNAKDDGESRGDNDDG